ncbi:MAG: ferritin family protein, partial [Clostridia bacterium]
MNEIKFKVDLPYPTVTKCNCKRDAEMLMNAYSGCVGSELSGILQYIYQSYWLKNCYPEIADILEEIAIVEMHHHAMLAEAIVNSCGDPVMSGANMSWWKGDCVCYQKDVICLLKKDICDEQMAIATYQKLACQVCNQTIKELLLRLVLDEEAHVQILKMLCQMVKSSCDPCQQPKQQCGCNNNCSCERQQGCCEKQ